MVPSIIDVWGYDREFCSLCIYYAGSSKLGEMGREEGGREGN